MVIKMYMHHYDKDLNVSGYLGVLIFRYLDMLSDMSAGNQDLSDLIFKGEKFT